MHLHEAYGVAANSAQSPSADDVRLMLFARTDREKEDWYRRFVAASKGCIADRMPSPLDGVGSDMVFVHEDDCGIGSGVALGEQPEEGAPSSTRSSVGDETSETTAAAGKSRSDSTVGEQPTLNNDGLLMSPSAARGPVEYVRFMGHYQVYCCFLFLQRFCLLCFAHLFLYILFYFVCSPVTLKTNPSALYVPPFPMKIIRKPVQVLRIVAENRQLSRLRLKANQFVL